MLSLMDLTLLYFDGCPNGKVADERVTLLASERPDITVTYQLVETPEQADLVGFFGSPAFMLTVVIFSPSLIRNQAWPVVDT